MWINKIYKLKFSQRTKMPLNQSKYFQAQLTEWKTYVHVQNKNPYFKTIMIEMIDSLLHNRHMCSS